LNRSRTDEEESAELTGGATGLVERAWGDNVAQRRGRFPFRCDLRHSGSRPPYRNPVLQKSQPLRREGLGLRTGRQDSKPCRALRAARSVKPHPGGAAPGLCVSAMERICSPTPALRRNLSIGANHVAKPAAACRLHGIISVTPNPIDDIGVTISRDRGFSG